MSESSRHQENTTEQQPPQDSVTPATTEIYTALQNERRRHVIDIIDTHGCLPIRELARRVAAREHDTTTECVDANDFNSVYVTLYQRHLDTLDQAGIVTYDDRDLVTSTDRTRPVRELMETVATSEVIR